MRKQVVRLNESQLRQIVKESVKKVLNEENSKKPFYVAADVYSEEFDTYDEAYQYALSLAKKEQDWYDPILLMDNERWETLVQFDERGENDIENGRFTPAKYIIKVFKIYHSIVYCLSVYTTIIRKKIEINKSVHKKILKKCRFLSTFRRFYCQQVYNYLFFSKNLPDKNLKIERYFSTQPIKRNCLTLWVRQFLSYKVCSMT